MAAQCGNLSGSTSVYVRSILPFDNIFHGAPTVPVPSSAPALGADIINNALYIGSGSAWNPVSGAVTAGTVTAPVALTSNVIPKGTGAATVANSSVTDDGTSLVTSDINVRVPSNGVFQVSTDTGVSRTSAGAIGVGSGTAGDRSGTLLAGGVQAQTLVASGIAGASTGSVTLAGATSGTVTIKPQAAAGTWEFDLPVTAGTAGQVLTSQAGAGTACTWTTVSAGGGVGPATIGNYAKFDSATTVNNSFISDDGVQLTASVPIKLPAGTSGNNNEAIQIGESGTSGGGIFAPGAYLAFTNFFLNASGFGIGCNAAFAAPGVATTLDGLIGWTPNSSVNPSTSDTTLGRVAAGIVNFGVGTTLPQGWFNYAGQTRVVTDVASTSTTLGTVTSLSVVVKAGRSYRFHAVLYVDADVVGGQKYAIAGTATATGIIYNVLTVNDATNAIVISSRQTALGGAIGQAGAATNFTTIDGTITVNAGGTLLVQFAQNVASGTSTVKAGSVFVVEDFV